VILGFLNPKLIYIINNITIAKANIFCYYFIYIGLYLYIINKITNISYNINKIWLQVLINN
jgi:hypothetical protein